MDKKILWFFLIIISLVFGLFYIGSFYSRLIFGVIITLVFLIFHESYWKKWFEKQDKKILFIKFFAGLILLQAAVPIFAPNIDISFGETRYGIVTDEDTWTSKELIVGIRPPLFPLVKCQEYDLGYVLDVVEPIYLSVVEVNEGSDKYRDLPNYYKGIKVCLKRNIDNWVFNKVTTSVDFQSVQRIPIFIDSKRITRIPNPIGENYFIIDKWDFDDSLALYRDISISNKAYYPVYLINKIYLINNTDLTNSILEITKKAICDDNMMSYYFVNISDNGAEGGIIAQGSVYVTYIFDRGNVSVYFPESKIEARDEKNYRFKLSCIPK